MIFLDANYFLRYLVQPDSPANQTRHETVTRLFAAVQAGHEEITTSEAIVAEVAFVLSSPRQYHLPPAEVAARLKPILRLRGFKHPQKRRYLRALDVWVSFPHLGFADAPTVASVEGTTLRLATFDTDFDGIPGIPRYVG